MLKKALGSTSRFEPVTPLARFSTRSPLAPTRGFLGLLIVFAALWFGWRWWHHARWFQPDVHAEARGTLTGRPRVGDGDGLTFSGARVRLVGIDAPELAQSCDDAGGRRHACGEEARRHLVGLIGGRTVECNWAKLDRYGRRLGLCRADDEDLNAAMVRDGWAVAYGAYEAEEAEARAARRGVWAGTFTWPQDWRREHRHREIGRAHV